MKKTLDLDPFKKTMFYRKFSNKKGTLFKELDEIVRYMQDIIELALNKEEIEYETDPKLNFDLDRKFAYTEKIIEIFEQKVKIARKNNMKYFLCYADSHGIADRARESFTEDAGVLLEYLYQAKNLLADLVRQQAVRNLNKEILVAKTQHLSAISQSLIPSSQSITSLIIPELLTEIAKHAVLNSQLSKEQIDVIVNQTAKSLADYLYKSENGIAVSMLNGMREHYIHQLSQYEDLYHEDIKTKALLQASQQENQEAHEKLAINSSQSNQRIDILEKELAKKNQELQEQSTIIDRLEGTIEAQKECINHQTETLLQLQSPSREKLNTNLNGMPKKLEQNNNERLKENFFSKKEVQKNNKHEEKNKKAFPWFKCSVK
ncbi:MAG: hypothetical protein H2069_03475 [Legionella sp.]|nr:hypothetical protein [Legionella sp.]